MKATLVSDKLTPYTPQEAGLALRSAYETVCGRTPSNACLALLMAQSALETGRWKKIHCHNWGNVKAGPEYTGKYCQFRCNEVINGKIEWFDPPHPQTNFRAFDSAESGAIDHIRFLSQRKRYAKAWEVAQTGMPLAFVDALKSAGYFTADPAPYRSGVASLWNEYMKLVEQLKTVAPETESEVTDDELCTALSCVAPDAERFLHTEAVLAAAASMDGVWDAINRERREAMKEEP